MKRILCILITAIWLCTCWAGNGKKPIVWEQPIAESNQIFNDPFNLNSTSIVWNSQMMKHECSCTSLFAHTIG